MRRSFVAALAALVAAVSPTLPGLAMGISHSPTHPKVHPIGPHARKPEYWTCWVLNQATGQLTSANRPTEKAARYVAMAGCRAGVSDCVRKGCKPTYPS